MRPTVRLLALAGAVLLMACGPGAEGPAGPPPTEDQAVGQAPGIDASPAGPGPDATPPSPDGDAATGGEDGEGQDGDGQDGDGQATADRQPVEIDISVVATDLDAPWDVAFADGRVFVTERDTGRVLELADGRTTEVLTLEVDNAGEGGLLGLAASPDFADDGLLYAYTTTAGDNRVLRFPADGGPPEAVLTGIPAGRIHNGGRLAFHDGLLYAATGDSGNEQLAQDPASLAGKVLRVTADGRVPPGNPFDGSPVWTLGHRNVQGLAWAPDGALYASEFGPDRDDEINVLQPGGNYGWPIVTGRSGDERFVDPIVVRQPPEASWSGAEVLTDGAIPQWEGDLFSAALRGGRLWRFPRADGMVVEDRAEDLLVGDVGRLRAVAQAPDGSLWLLTSNTDGRGDPGPDDDRILRLAPAPGR